MRKKLCDCNLLQLLSVIIASGQHSLQSKLQLATKTVFISNRPGPRLIRKIIHARKLAFIPLTVAILFIHAPAMSQTITLAVKQAPLEQVFEQVKKKTNYVFFYKKEDLRDIKPVTIQVSNLSIVQFLKQIFQDQPLDFLIEKNAVIISRKIDSKHTEAKSDGNGSGSPHVRGLVSNASGEPVPGASISVKASNRGVSANNDGTFSIEAGPGDILLISSVGYKTLEYEIKEMIPVPGPNNSTWFRRVYSFQIPIVIQKSESRLDEVQVMGYGTTTRRSGTGTISSVKSDVIEKQNVGNVINLIDGRMSGVQVVQQNGMPGAGFAVKVRGDNTLGPNFGFSSSDPLYIVDGVPQITGYRSFDTRVSIGVFGMNGATNMLSNLNPKDILQIDVLKDADATAIYGARGANGVVLITTKKGQPGKIRLNVDLSAGGGKIPRFIPVLSTPQYLELRKEAFANEGITPNAANAPDLVTWSQTLDNDFQRIIFGGTAKQSNANMSISGGSENVKYYVGLNYRKEGTVMPGNYSVKRTGGLINLDATSLNRKFNASFSVSYSNEQSDIPSVSFPALLFAPPNYNPYNEDGTFNWNRNFTNPFAALLSKYEATNTLLNSSMVVSYKPVNGLTLKVLSAGPTIIFKDPLPAPTRFLERHRDPRLFQRAPQVVILSSHKLFISSRLTTANSRPWPEEQ